eukprot:5776962-Lingulodinium_polyedra.AAC.1
MADRLCKHLQCCKQNSETDWGAFCDIASMEVPCFWHCRQAIHERDAYEYLNQRTKMAAGKVSAQPEPAQPRR